jgi:glycosyltransferase involved in cell wall biosynthesis
MRGATLRIASLIPKQIVNSIYRSIVPMNALARRGHTVHIEERDIGHDFQRLREFDVVHVLRLCDEPTQALTRRLKEAGVALVWDNDDNLTAVERGNPNYKLHAREGHRIALAMRAIMTRADLVTTTNPTLADLYRRASGSDVRVIENFLPATFTPPDTRVPHDGVWLGWVAAGEHQRDVERLRLTQVLTDLLARHPQLSVVTVGLNLGLRDDRYYHVPHQDYPDLPKCLVEFDVGIAPLADLPFNRGRSNVKLKEYAAMGLPWLASPIGPYAEMGEKEGGRLVADDRWREEIERLILDARARRKLGRNGMRWARGQTIDGHVEAWERALVDAVAHARA